MKKRFLCLALALFMMAGCFVACNDGGDYIDGGKKGDDWKKILTESCQETVKSSVLVHAIAEVEGMEQITDEEFKAELDYLVDYYSSYGYTAEYIREQMGDEAIKESALFGKVQELIMERITIKYE